MGRLGHLGHLGRFGRFLFCGWDWEHFLGSLGSLLGCLNSFTRSLGGIGPPGSLDALDTLGTQCLRPLGTHLRHLFGTHGAHLDGLGTLGALASLAGSRCIRLPQKDKRVKWAGGRVCSWTRLAYAPRKAKTMSRRHSSNAASCRRCPAVTHKTNTQFFLQIVLSKSVSHVSSRLLVEVWRQGGGP